MKRILVLAAGILQIPIIKKAHEMGLFVIAADANPQAVGFQYADKSVVANITDEDKMLHIAMQEKIDGVIHPCSEVSMSVMGHINDKMCLCGISRETAVRATNKHLMREAFERNGVPSPQSFLVNSVEEAWTTYKENLTGDGILKPSRNSGSRGVSKVTPNITFDSFAVLYKKALSESRDHSVLLEQYVSGPEFSVEIIVWKGHIHILTVTDKLTTGAPHFVELGHNQPSCYLAEIVKVVEKVAYDGVKALGLNNCAAHAEIKVQDGSPYIMEIGARLGGDFISTELTPLSTGIDMIAAAINVALNIKPQLTPTEKKHAVCIRYFCPPPGKLKSINNTSILEDDSVYQYEIYRKVGERIPELTSSLDRSGHVIVLADTPSAAIEKADKIINSVKFEIE